jgi:YidC/Oxa1 family membrane protein insertase
MIAAAFWQEILKALGTFLSLLYGWLPNYGVAIILFTLSIRIVLLPLGIKQIRSMQAMQSVQPKVKAIQQKYKGKPDGRQKINEETMALYKEYGVNPLSGCLPVLMQLPVLFALFSILRVPGGVQHIPADSRLRADISVQRTHFLGANLLCSAMQAGKPFPIETKPGETNLIKSKTLDCGNSAASRVPYYAFALAMIGTTYYQQRQMQKAQPPGTNPQAQALTKFMPLLFGFWGFLFPAGLVVYWTTTNLIQIGQQHFMLPKVAAGQADAAPAGGDGARKPTPKPARDQAPKRPQGRPRPGAAPMRPTRAGERRSTGRTPRPGTGKKPDPPGGNKGQAGNRGSSTGSGGGSDGGDRKKRRKR